jgi:hypothetical protein
MDPHAREYAAAIDGLRDQTPTRAVAPSAGETAHGVTCGREWRGTVEWLSDDGSMCVDVGGAWIRVPQSDKV